MHDFVWWGAGWGPMFMFIFWGLILVGVVALLRSFGTESSSRRRRQKTAIEIVQERYARGEIDRQEYEQKMKDLEQRT